MAGFRIHIVGCAPRAGTTLLKELVNGGFETESLAPHEVSVLVRPRHLRGVCVSKHPNEVSTARLLLPLDPHLWVIYSLRDPRDVVCSRHPNDLSQYWVGFDTWERYDRVARRIKHPRFLTVRYEDVITKPDATQDSLLRSMPFLVRTRRFSEALAAVDTSEASRRAMHHAGRIHRDSIGGWKRYTPRIADQLDRYPELKDELVVRGYESDHEWISILRDVRREPIVEKNRYRRRRWLTRRRLNRAWLAVKYLGKLVLDRSERGGPSTDVR